MAEYVDQHLRLICGDYPQTVEGNLQYAVDRMLAAEGLSLRRHYALLMIKQRIERMGALDAEDLQVILTDCEVED